MVRCYAQCYQESLPLPTLSAPDSRSHGLDGRLTRVGTTAAKHHQPNWRVFLVCSQVTCRRQREADKTHTILLPVPHQKVKM